MNNPAIYQGKSYNQYPAGSVERGICVILDTIASQGFIPVDRARLEMGDDVVSRMLAENLVAVREKPRATNPNKIVRHLIAV